MEPQSDITRILQSAVPNDPNAATELLPLVYEELRKLAAAHMAREPSQTLQPTALVHEAWMKLGGADQQNWNGRGHFFGAAAEAMRRILIDRARKRNRVRHGAGLQRVQLDDVNLAATTDDNTLLALNEALEKFAAESPEKAHLVRLRYFTGLTLEEAAGVLGVSLATAKRHWAYARAWLMCALQGD